MLRISIPLATITAALALLVGAGAAPAAPTSYLYVQQTAAGGLTHTAHGWRLVLRDPSPEITTFADRPARVGGSLSITRFVARWRAEFRGSAPNAALEISGAPASHNIVLLELGRPTRNARQDTITFAVTPLKSIAATRLQTLARGADPLRAGSFGRASLFIDDGATMQFPFSMTFTGTSNGSGVALTFDQAQLALSPSDTSVFQSSEGMTFGYTPGSISVLPDAQDPDPWSATAVGFLGTIGGQPVTGYATVQSGATVSVTIGTGPATTISHTGTFSIPTA